ncbi:MAG: acyl-CoA thioesterase [Candidatus Cyclobacteriaceae bacterium M3_2C_046]
MYQFETSIRVRYAETDQMGIVYYGNYATYYEIARVEALRNLNFTYRELEEMGTVMPVLELKCKYIRPARYDDLLKVVVKIEKLPDMRMGFKYEIFKQDDVLINIGETTLVFVDRQTGKPCTAPSVLLDIMTPYFS